MVGLRIAAAATAATITCGIAELGGLKRFLLRHEKLGVVAVLERDGRGGRQRRGLQERAARRDGLAVATRRERELVVLLGQSVDVGQIARRGGGGCGVAAARMLEVAAGRCRVAARMLERARGLVAADTAAATAGRRRGRGDVSDSAPMRVETVVCLNFVNGIYLLAKVCIC